MPAMMPLNNVSIPKKLISFEKIHTTNDKHGYIHFFVHDKLFQDFIANVKDYVPLLSQFDGILTPDCSMAIGQLDYLQKTNNYFRQAVGVYLQQCSQSVIPTIRWSDEESLNYCLNGIPKNYIVAISTHGCIKSNEQKDLFRKCLIKTLEILQPTDVLVYGYMPKRVFDGLDKMTNFHRYPNHFEEYCLRRNNNGNI